VKNRSVLRDVDVLAPEHRVPALGDAALVGELAEQLQRLVGDPVLRVVEEESSALGGQALAAAGVLGEDLSQVAAADLGVVALEGLPGLGLAEGRRQSPKALRPGASWPA
jgi:hypothetical protein